GCHRRARGAPVSRRLWALAAGYGGALKNAGRGTFATLLRQYRTAAGLTQEALADKAGLSVRGIADLGRGARRVPQFRPLRSLAQALELSPEERVALVAAGQRPGRTRPAELPLSTARHCGHCDRDNAPEADFCVDCGAPLEV